MRSKTKTKTSSREIKRQKKAQKLLIAVENLMNDGLNYSEIAVEDLCAEAGMARSTFYVYFEDKASLILELGKQVIAELLSSGDLWWSVADQAPSDKLEKSIQSILADYAKHGVVLATLKETANWSDEAASLLQHFIDSTIDNALKSVNKGKKAGIIKADVSDEEVISLCWMVERVSSQCTSNKTKKSAVKKYSKALSKIVWNTLYVKEY